MILGLWSRGVVRQVYVDLITGFINTESTWNRMATGINEKSKQILVFFTRLTAQKMYFACVLVRLAFNPR